MADLLSPDMIVDASGKKLSTSAGLSFASRSDARPPARNANARTNLKRYQLYRNLVLGGTYITNPPPDTEHPLTGGALPNGSYLVRLPMEKRRKDGTDPYYERCVRASHRPVCSRIIKTYIATFDRQPVDRSDMRRTIGEVIYEDVDGNGTSIDEFLIEAFWGALTYGWIGVMTHLPPVEPGQFVSRADELAAGLRPWCEIVSPIRIWDFVLNPITKRMEYVLVFEGGEGEARRWRAWTSDSWAIITPTGEVEREGAHSFGRVPMDIMRALPSDTTDALAPLGQSPIADAADLEIEAFNVWSLHTKSERISNFRFLHCDRDPSEIKVSATEGDKAIGEEFMMYTRGTVQWIEPNPAVTQENRDHLQDLEEQILLAGGVHWRSETSVEDHSGKALEYEFMPRDDYVRRLAGSLKAFEQSWWPMLLESVGIAVPTPLPIRYPTEVTTAPTDLMFERADRIAKIYGGYGQAPDGAKIFINLLVSRAAKHEVGHLAESGEIVDSLKSALDVEEPDPQPAFEDEGDDDGDSDA